MPGILHITYSGIGGMAEACLTLVSAAVENGGEHHVLFHGVDQMPQRYIDRCRDLGVPFHYIPKRTRLYQQETAEVTAYLEAVRPDVVISHMPQTVFAFWRYRRSYPASRLIAVEHHSNALKGPKRWGLSVINNWAANRTIYLTGEYREQVKARLGFLIRDASLAVIPNGIDTDQYCPAASRVPEAETTIGMQGRMVPTKDYVTLLHAFALVSQAEGAPELRLEIAGDGPMWGELETLAEALGIREQVVFLGMLQQEQLIDRMQHWDIFVLSTLGETMSRALMEAQSCALPVVATEVSGVTAAILPGETGLLVPVKDSQALAHALQRLISSPLERARLAGNARRFAVENFSSRKTWQNYENLVNAF